MKRHLIMLAYLVSQTANSAPSDMALTLMASPAGFAAGSSLGHAFACISLQLNSGIKEDCLGFYPKSTSSVIVGGPGVVRSEFKENPKRFSTIVSSFTTPITVDQRRAIYTTVNNFNDKNYSLTDTNCIDMVAAIARAAGLSVPARSPSQTPAEFLEAMKQIN